ncbi:MAG: hypothetical protein E7812_07135 [Phenylobacterium sp.]|nr:MAG: hypothetical protein E7812_07135 [Phenylobacterium sp.]
MAVPDTVFDDVPAQPYKAVRKLVRDGDVLLCSAHDPMSRLIRWATSSPWSHVAMGFRLEEIDRVIVLECVERLGVRAVPLSSFVARTSSGKTPYPGKILLARHEGFAAKSRQQPMKRIAEVAFDRLGERFSQGEMLKIALRIALGRLHVRMPRTLGPDDEFICSEYVARCLETVGIKVPWDGYGFIAPADIARDPRLEPLAQIATR